MCYEYAGIMCVSAEAIVLSALPTGSSYCLSALPAGVGRFSGRQGKICFLFSEIR